MFIIDIVTCAYTCLTVSQQAQERGHPSKLDGPGNLCAFRSRFRPVVPVPIESVKGDCLLICFRERLQRTSEQYITWKTLHKCQKDSAVSSPMASAWKECPSHTYWLVLKNRESVPCLPERPAAHFFDGQVRPGQYVGGPQYPARSVGPRAGQSPRHADFI